MFLRNNEQNCSKFRHQTGIFESNFLQFKRVKEKQVGDFAVGA